MGRVGKERKAERREGEREGRGGEKQPDDFLVVKKILSLFADDETHQILQPTATNSPGSTNTASSSDLQSGRLSCSLW